MAAGQSWKFYKNVTNICFDKSSTHLIGHHIPLSRREFLITESWAVSRSHVANFCQIWSHCLQSLAVDVYICRRELGI